MIHYFQMLIAFFCTLVLSSPTTLADDLKRIDEPFFYSIEKKGTRIWFFGDGVGVTLSQLPSYVAALIYHSSDIAIPVDNILDQSYHDHFKKKFKYRQKWLEYLNSNIRTSFQVSYDAQEIIKQEEYEGHSKTWHVIHSTENAEKTLDKTLVLDHHLDDFYSNLIQASYQTDESKYRQQIVKSSNYNHLGYNPETIEHNRRLASELESKLLDLWSLAASDAKKSIVAIDSLIHFIGYQEQRSVKKSLENMGFHIQRIDTPEKAAGEIIELIRRTKLGIELKKVELVDQYFHEAECGSGFDHQHNCHYEANSLEINREEFSYAENFYQKYDYRQLELEMLQVFQNFETNYNLPLNEWYQQMIEASSQSIRPVITGRL